MKPMLPRFLTGILSILPEQVRRFHVSRVLTVSKNPLLPPLIGSAFGFFNEMEGFRPVLVRINCSKDINLSLNRQASRHPSLYIVKTAKNSWHINCLLVPYENPRNAAKILNQLIIKDIFNSAQL